MVVIVDGMDMHIMPTTYKSWGDILQKYSEDVIKEVKLNNQKYKIVVDLGSGLGNNSELLFNALNIDNLLGVDIDENMVKYANSRKSNDKINFLAQDVSLEWNKIRPEIKDLEGRVELILSSFVLHFIANRKSTTENLCRLLAPGAIFYGNVICLSDLFNTQTNGYGIPMKIPTAQQQLDLWAEAFKNAGFRIEKSKLFKLEAPMPLGQYKNTFASIISICYEIFMTEPNANKRKQLVEKVKEKMIETVVKFPADMFGTQMVRCECEIFTIKVIKE